MTSVRVALCHGSTLGAGPPPVAAVWRGQRTIVGEHSFRLTATEPSRVAWRPFAAILNLFASTELIEKIAA